MSKYSLVRLMENEEDGNFSVGKTTYNLVVTPTEIEIVDKETGKSTTRPATPEDIITALDNIDNYGIYASNVRNTAVNKATINKEVEKYFGTPIQRRSDKTGKLPPYNKPALDAFIKQFTSKPQLLKPTIEGNTVVFYQKGNPTKVSTEKIIKTILNNAKIKYKLSEKES
jgi:hypothetical protein